MDASSLMEGHCKFRDGKKWKTRWAVITKLSPVADCLQLQIYRDEKERARHGHTKASLSLQHFLALESGFTLDKESHTLAIICQDLSVVLAFDNRERLIQWSVRIANNLGEGHQFLVQLASAPSKSKLTPGPVKLHVTDRKFCLTGGIPPRLLGAWEVSHLRRYGIVEGRLVFEGGSRCGRGEGVHVLVPDPPQIHLIVDALDMSSKGQLVRMPSRRFGSVADSPRKSMTSRLSEMRSMTSMLPAESSTNVSMTCPAVTPNTSAMALGLPLGLSRNLSPTPRESRSAEELCTSCTTSSTTSVDVPPNHGVGQSGGPFWHSESSSRSDLDTVDNPMNGEDIKSPASPVKSQQQINKPLPSAMERCLSCMSKLGAQGGQDVLSPSWTMDLNGMSAAAGMSNSMSQSQVVPKTGGSMGSGNSDRLSVSSHGSSGGVTEFYYDTPRSVLMAEMRRQTARSNTPPVPPSSATFSCSGSNQPSELTGCCSGGSHYSNPHCSSPQRLSLSVQRNMSSSGTGCGFNGCHCHAHGQLGNCPARVPTGPQQQQQQQPSPIYYNTSDKNEVYESHGKPGSGAKTPINLHPAAYENYDFPRCASQQHQPNSAPLNSNSVNCCANLSNPLTGHSTCNNIDWSKKSAMDRSSVASTALGSDHSSEFYDTPRRFNEGVPSSSASCCNSFHNNPNATASGHNHAHNQSQNQNQGPASLCPCCVTHDRDQGSHCQQSSVYAKQSGYQTGPQFQNFGPRIADPLENYDVPPACTAIATTRTSGNGAPVTTSNGSGVRLNGEGKMPLVTGNLNSLRYSATNVPIYAQVDKSKKTHRLNNPAASASSSSTSHCDNKQQHIYQNAQPATTFPQQPNYSNIEQVKNLPPKKALLLGGQASFVQRSVSSDTAAGGGCTEDKNGGPGSNYVNLDFSDSLCLYENSRDVRCSRENNVSEGVAVQSDLVADKNKLESKVPENPASGVNSSKVSGSVSGLEDLVPGSGSTNNAEHCQQAGGGEVGGEESKSGRSYEQSDEGASLPLRRSSSVPCKGGHANRGSASSSDSGVSGDGGLFFEDGSPLGDFGSLCLHESLPRKGQRSSPSSSTGGKNTSATSTPKPTDSLEVEMEGDADTTPTEATVPGHVYSSPKESLAGSPPKDGVNNNENDPLVHRHYETIDEMDSSKTQNPLSHPVQHHNHALQRPKNHPLTLVSDANSTSSGASDMSDYIETLSSCSRGSSDTVNLNVNHHHATFAVLHGHGGVVSSSADISASPKRSTNMKPRSGKEYFKIDRTLFSKHD